MKTTARDIPPTRRSWNDPPAPLPWVCLGTYIDTLAVRLLRQTGHDLDRIPEQEALARLCGTLHVEQSGRDTYTRVLMHQPSHEALLIADDLVDGHHGLIQEVHFALEVEASSPTNAEMRAEYLARRVRRRWARTPWCFSVGDELGNFATSSKRWDVDRFRLYPGRSKLLAGQRCVRIERQVSGTGKAMKAIHGLSYPSEVPGVLDEDFWREQLRFEEVNLGQLGRQARGRARAKRPDVYQRGRFRYDNDLAVGGAISCLARVRANEPWVEGSAMAVRDHCRGEPWFNPRTALRPLSLSSIVITPPTSSFPPLGSSTPARQVEKPEQMEASTHVG